MVMADDRPSRDDEPYDLVFIGGGLANGLLAFRLTQLRPGLRLLVLEAGESIGGNHTWSFHDGDLTPEQHAWLEPFVVHRWPAYSVRFPQLTRTLETGYQSVTSERFASVLAARLGDSLRCGAEVTAFDARSVTLAGGERVRAACVVDGRGPTDSPHLTLGFQKFLGQEIALDAPHGLAHPIIMDATIPQADGYHFVYVLPLGPSTVLVEDTYYADGPVLEPARLRQAIAAYLDGKGWTATKILREEEGVLPIALGGDIEKFWVAKAGIASVGLAAALFHPTTGYSLPDAVRLADRIAGLHDLSAPSVFAATRKHSVRSWKGRRFFRMLNRLLFLAGAPALRYRILQHFYRLPDGLVERFYADRLKPFDRLRILTGKPPVPISSALRVLAFPSRSRKAVSDA